MRTDSGTSVGAADFAEQIPPVSRGTLYAAPQVRYCLAESIRIEAVRSVLDKSEPGGVEEFNARIADFNGRCGSYRYLQSEIFFVQRDVEDYRLRLQTEARDAYLKRAAARKALRAKAPDAPSQASQLETLQKPPPPSPPRGESTGEPTRADSKPQPPPASPEPGQAVAQQSPGLPAPPEARPAPPAAQSAAPAPVAEPVSLAATPEPRLPGSASQAVTAAPPEPPRQARSPEATLTAPLQSATEPVNTVPAQPAAEPVNPPPAQPSVKPADRPTAAAASDAALSRYLRDIQRTGSRVLDESHYPATARGKGWAGTTQIDVQFAEGGFIRSILLGESSGYPDFDTRALEFARGIMFPPRPKVLYAREFTVRFPIAFKPGKAR